MIGVDPEHKGTAWIESGITYHIPDEKVSPELHCLVSYTGAAVTVGVKKSMEVLMLPNASLAFHKK